jgi:hypothetical protein
MQVSFRNLQNKKKEVYYFLEKHSLTESQFLGDRKYIIFQGICITEVLQQEFRNIHLKYNNIKKLRDKKLRDGEEKLKRILRKF